MDTWCVKFFRQDNVQRSTVRAYDIYARWPGHGPGRAAWSARGLASAPPDSLPPHASRHDTRHTHTRREDGQAQGPAASGSGPPLLRTNMPVEQRNMGQTAGQIEEDRRAETEQHRERDREQLNIHSTTPRGDSRGTPHGRRQRSAGTSQNLHPVDRGVESSATARTITGTRYVIHCSLARLARIKTGPLPASCSACRCAR